MTLKRGSLLNNRYRIIDILGLGGMGSVYKAVDENLGMKVAVKENLFTTDEFARQFHREALILAGLRHHNLPRVTDHFVIEGQGQYLVMDYIEGEDLRQRMDRLGSLSEDEVIKIGAAICDALTYLGSREPPIVHRDIKPGNVRITPYGEIYLVDFGLAKVWETDEKTATGARAMTPGYSPPEQYGTARTDQRSDIYSLGATLYAAITTYIPEDAMSRAMEQTKLTPIEVTNPDISQDLAVAIETALEVKPDNRFQNPAEFKAGLLRSNATLERDTGEFRVSPAPKEIVEDDIYSGELTPVSTAEGENNNLQSIAGSDPISPNGLQRKQVELSGEGVSKQERGFWVRYWWMLPIAGIIIIISLIIVSKTDLPEQALAMVVSPTPTQTISFPTPIDTPDPNIYLSTIAASVGQTLTPYLTPSPILTEPTATQLIAPSITPTPTVTVTPTTAPTPKGGGNGKLAYASNRSGVPQIFIKDIISDELFQLTNINEGACQPDWSPDGRWIAFITPCEGHQEEYWGTALFIIDMESKDYEPMPLPTLPGGDYDPEWSPDGEYIIFTSLRETGRPRLYTMNIADKTVKLLSETYTRDRQATWSSDGNQIAFVTTQKGLKEIWTMNTNGSDRQRFSHSGDAANLYPDWSPDGEVILFTQYFFGARVPRLVGGYYGEQRYTEFQISQGPFPMREAQYSPDGLWLIFEGWPDGKNHDIYIMTTNGSGLKRITEDPADDFDGTWGPGL